MLCLAAWCVQFQLLFSLQALAERYSGHLGRPLDAMKEAALRFAIRTAVRTMLAFAFFFMLAFASGRCDRGCYQCFVLGHAGGTW